MASTVRKHRLNPFKVLCLLLYGEYDFVHWNGLEVTVRNGPLSRLLRVQNYRLQEYLEWLAHWGYITDLDTETYGESRFVVTLPYRFAEIDELRRAGGSR